MSIFRREDQPDYESPTPPARPAARPAASEARVTEIAGGSKVVGEISGATGLRVLGEVDGKLRIDGEVVIGESGRVQGEIRAQVVKVAGKVVGNVRGLESVSILARGSLEGDVVSPRMSIAEGAFFKGKVEMTGDGDGPAAPAKSAVPPRPSGPPEAKS